MAYSTEPWYKIQTVQSRAKKRTDWKPVKLASGPLTLICCFHRDVQVFALALSTRVWASVTIKGRWDRLHLTLIFDGTFPEPHFTATTLSELQKLQLHIWSSLTLSLWNNKKSNIKETTEVRIKSKAISTNMRNTKKLTTCLKKSDIKADAYLNDPISAWDIMKFALQLAIASFHVQHLWYLLCVCSGHLYAVQ